MNFLKKCLRLLAAGLTALVLLTGFCNIYSRWPVHIPNPRGNTDYVWQPDFPWMLMTEGVSWGRTDSAGFNNPRVIEHPDVLILGSSHMEAKNVPQGLSTAAQLQTLLGDGLQVYNLGVSGHFFAKVCQYLRTNLELYDPVPGYVILETDSLRVTEEDVRSILDHTVEFTPSHTQGPVAALQKNPFLRHAFHVFTTGWIPLLFPEAGERDPMFRVVLKNPPAAPRAPQVEPGPYEQLFSYLGDLQEEFGTRIILFHHPAAILREDGSVSYQIPPETEVFREYCEKNGLIFLDMQEPFRAMTGKTHRLPHGFLTGEPGSGHLNRYGHGAIAGELARIINELEDAK